MYVLLSFVLYHWKGKNLISKIGVEIANNYVANKNEPYWKKKNTTKIHKENQLLHGMYTMAETDRQIVCVQWHAYHI